MRPRLAYENLQRLRDDGREGTYGFYEAVDYTRFRVCSQAADGATILSYARCTIRHEPAGARLCIARGNHAAALPGLPAPESLRPAAARRVLKTVSPPFSPTIGTCAVPARSTRKPQGHARDRQSGAVHPGSASCQMDATILPSAARVAATAAGSDLAVTRWREDATRDCWGAFIYLRDAETGSFWSASHQPGVARDESLPGHFTQARAEFRQRQRSIEAHTEITVSRPEDDLELRRVTLTNHSEKTRTIELTGARGGYPGSGCSGRSASGFQQPFRSNRISFRSGRHSLHPPGPFRRPTGHPGFSICWWDRAASRVTSPARLIATASGRGRTPLNPLRLAGAGPAIQYIGLGIGPVIALRPEYHAGTRRICPGRFHHQHERKTRGSAGDHRQI